MSSEGDHPPFWPPPPGLRPGPKSEPNTQFADEEDRRSPQAAQHDQEQPVDVSTDGVLEVRGHTGTVRLDADFVTMIRKGFLARGSVGRARSGYRSARSRRAVQQLACVNGFIQFTLGGGNEGRSGLDIRQSMRPGMRTPWSSIEDRARSSRSCATRSRRPLPHVTARMLTRPHRLRNRFRTRSGSLPRCETQAPLLRTSSSRRNANCLRRCRARPVVRRLPSTRREGSSAAGGRHPDHLDPSVARAYGDPTAIQIEARANLDQTLPGP